MNYYFLLDKHKNLSLKRKMDYKKNMIIAILVIIFSMMYLTSLFFLFSKENLEKFSVFFTPVIIFLDFSIRFFIKKNISAAIIPYLTFPISRKTLILYIVLSDFSNFCVWGCWLVYSLILYYYGILTFWTTVILLLFVLLNNYLIAFVKALIGGYAILTYPICLGFVSLILFFAGILKILIVIFTIFLLVVALFFTLKENLYKELDCIAL